MKGLEVLSTGYAKINHILDNQQLEKMVDTSDEWIVSRTGIKKRHISCKNSVDLAIEAAKEAIKNIDQSKIGLIICATMTPANRMPSNACLIQAGLNLNEQDMMCFDISAACSGFVYTMTIANSLLKTMDDRYALIIGSEQLSSIIDYQDRNTCILFGDGAGAMVVKNSQNDFYSYQNSAGNQEVLSAKNDPQDYFLKMKGQEVFKFAIKVIPESIDQVLNQAGLTLDDIDYVVCHQANYRIIKHVYKKYHCNPDKFYMNLDEYGNTSAASIPLALATMNEKGLIKKGMKLILVGFGGGLTWGATLIEW